MKKIIILAFLILSSKISFSQKIPFEKLEEFSKQISKTQSEVNGKTYNDGETANEISFPEANFTVAFNSQLATNVVYKKSNGVELLYLTENFSLSRLSGFTTELIDNDLILYKLDFGKFTVTTKIYEEGKLINTTYNDNLMVYAKYNKNKTGLDSDLFKLLFDLSTQQQIELGLIQKDKLEKENKDWGTLEKEDFVKKYQNSIRTMEAKNIIKNKKIAEINRLKERENEGEITFMNYNPSSFKLGLSVEDVKKTYKYLKLKINKSKKDELISSDGKVLFYFKNNKVYGYSFEVSFNSKEHENNLKYAFQLGNKERSNLQTMFQFKPSIEESDFAQFYYNIYDNYYLKNKIKYSSIPSDENFSAYNFHYKDGDKISYIWDKKGKIVRLDIVFLFNLGFMTLQRYGHKISITVINNSVIE